MIQYGFTNWRVAAVDLGRKMAAELGIFHHVTNDHEFRDNRLFYCFSHIEDRPTNNKMASFKMTDLENIGEIFRIGAVVYDIK